jgi:hypothetical protein
MEIHVTIDFYDDVRGAECEWTEEYLRGAVRDLAARGISAVHWIDCTTPEGFWEEGSYMDGPGGLGTRVRERIPEPLKVLCDEAHRCGIRAYAVLKPHDMAIGEPFASFPVGKGPDPPVGLPHVGGISSKAVRWLREHPDMRMRIHPSLEASPQVGCPINTIRIWHEEVELDGGFDFRLWTSPDNGRYEPYEGPTTRNDRVLSRKPPLFSYAPAQEYGPEDQYHCIEISGLDIDERFVALEVLADGGLANTLNALVELEDSSGQTVPFTYGIVPYQPYGDSDRDWREVGIAFDACRGLPLPGRGCTGTRSCLGYRLEIGALPCLGFARGRNTYLTGPLEFAHPEVNDWLLSIISRELDAGVDGVDLRFDTHTESLDWDNYGFAEPLMEEFQNRHGVDVRREKFDRSLWRRLRGEYLEAFLQRAGKAVRNPNRELFVHINNDMNKTPDEFSRYECYRDWRGWIRKGWVDGITFKSLKLRGEFEEELNDVCSREGVKRLSCEKPGLHGAGGMESDDGRIELLEKARRKNYEIFNLYELATYTHLGPDGRLVFHQPRFWDHVADIAESN